MYGGYPFWWPPAYGGAPSSATSQSQIADLERLLKLMKKAEKKEKKEQPKKDEKKPKTFTMLQVFFLLTATFPFIAPIYYYSVLGSVELLKIGLSTLIR